MSSPTEETLRAAFNTAVKTQDENAALQLIAHGADIYPFIPDRRTMLSVERILNRQATAGVEATARQVAKYILMANGLR